MLRVVADSNVYISAFNFGGPISKVLELAQEEHIALFVSEPIPDELKPVFSLKLGWTEERLRLAISNILEFTYLDVPEALVTMIV